MIKILFNDGVETKLKNDLIALGIEVDDNHYDGEQLVTVLNDCDALVVRSATKVREDLIQRLKNKKLKLIVRAGVGTDNIDVEYAKSCNIIVKNTPGASSNSVTELVLAHMLALSRFIVPSNITMRKGEWNKNLYIGTEITGKTLGIIGMGRIGVNLATKASAIGMNVIYNDINGKLDSAKDYKYVSLDELYANSDYISIHVPTTKTLISDAEFEKMKDGVIIVNTARGSIIKTEALLVAINSGKVAGAGLDVFDSEPKFNQSLVNNPRISATPHIGAATKEAQGRIAKEIFEIIKEVFKLQ